MTDTPEPVDATAHAARLQRQIVDNANNSIAALKVVHAAATTERDRMASVADMLRSFVQETEYNIVAWQQRLDAVSAAPAEAVPTSVISKPTVSAAAEPAITSSVTAGKPPSQSAEEPSGEPAVARSPMQLIEAARAAYAAAQEAAPDGAEAAHPQLPFAAEAVKTAG